MTGGAGEPALGATVRPGADLAAALATDVVDARVRWDEFRPVVEATTRAYLRRVAAEGLR